MYLLHLRPLFVELPIFVLGGLVLLEPRDLVREQTCRNLRRGAADLRGGEEHGNGKVERLLAGVRSGGTGLIGQQLRRPGQSGGGSSVSAGSGAWSSIARMAPTASSRLTSHARCVMPAGSVTA